MNSDHGPKHTGEAPARRPPDDEPERIGEGELGSEGPPVGSLSGDDEDDAREGREAPDKSGAAKTPDQNRKSVAAALIADSGTEAAQEMK